MVISTLTRANTYVSSLRALKSARRDGTTISMFWGTRAYGSHCGWKLELCHLMPLKSGVFIAFIYSVVEVVSFFVTLLTHVEQRPLLST